MRIFLTLLAASAVSGFMPMSGTKHTTALNNVGSKWAYDPYGKTHQENFLYRKDPNVDPNAGEVWYFQPWGFVAQPQFFPLPKTGIDMWYFEPRSVVPADDEFFHGKNSASHMHMPTGVASASAPASAPAAAPRALTASEQGAIPPAAQPQQMMPEPVQQNMPTPTQQMDSTMSAYDRAMAGN
jgi:hypothetical protein